MAEETTTTGQSKRLFSCDHVNWVPPETVQCYRGEIVRYAYEYEKDYPVLGGPRQNYIAGWEKRAILQTAETHIVLVDDGSSHPQLLVNIDNGSPSGYCWGYGGSGPHAVAMSMLAHHLGEWPRKGDPYDGTPLSFKMHGDLVRDMVSRWPMEEGWTLPRADLAAWCGRWLASDAGKEALREIGERVALEAQWAKEDAELERLEADAWQEGAIAAERDTRDAQVDVMDEQWRSGQALPEHGTEEGDA